MTHGNAVSLRTSILAVSLPGRFQDESMWNKLCEAKCAPIIWTVNSSRFVTDMTADQQTWTELDAFHQTKAISSALTPSRSRIWVAWPGLLHHCLILVGDVV